MSKVIALLLLVSARAVADPAPPAASPYVVPYEPPQVVDRSHRGLTLEVALGGGSTSLDASAGCVAFAIGGWISHDFALAFRATATGAYQFAGASGQYYATPSLWFGAGLGGLSERTMDAFETTQRGGGGFVRAGYNVTTRGSHALYISGELQVGQVADQTRSVGLLAIGYQLL